MKHKHTSCWKVGMETECCAKLMASCNGFTAVLEVLADKSCKRICNSKKCLRTYHDV